MRWSKLGITAPKEMQSVAPQHRESGPAGRTPALAAVMLALMAVVALAVHSGPSTRDATLLDTLAMRNAIQELLEIPGSGSTGDYLSLPAGRHRAGVNTSDEFCTLPGHIARVSPPDFYCGGAGSGSTAGFEGKFWIETEKLTQVPDTATLGEPDFTTRSNEIDYVNDFAGGMGGFRSIDSALGGNFTAKWKGEIAVVTGGTYTFFSRSDDGSKVFINGELVVDNDGLHLPTEVSATKDLEPGRYEVTVDMWENQGYAVEQLLYSGPDTGDKKILVKDDQTFVRSCKKCNGNCQSPAAAFNNRNTTGQEGAAFVGWNPQRSPDFNTNQYVDYDLGGHGAIVKALLWANTGDTTHDPANIKLWSSDDGITWTLAATIDVSGLQGDATIQVVPTNIVDTRAKYWRINPGGIQHQSIPRVMGLCNTVDCNACLYEDGQFSPAANVPDQGYNVYGALQPYECPPSGSLSEGIYCGGKYDSDDDLNNDLDRSYRIPIEQDPPNQIYIGSGISQA